MKSAIKKTIITGLAAVTVTTGIAPALANDKPDTIDGVKPIAATPEEGAQTGGASLGYGEKSKLGAPNPQGNNPNERQARQNGASFFSGGRAWRPNFGVHGQDVSNHQGNIDWGSQARAGSKFAWIKTSEGTSYKDPYFSQNYTGAREHGLLTGGYHFAIPTQSSGAEQARIFVNSGGGWSADGKTLPGMLDIEYNPYSSLGNTCYNLSLGQLTSWVRDFTSTYKNLTGRFPTIYSTTGWWQQCMGNTSEFNHMPLHIASYATRPGYMPGGSTSFDLWQYSSAGPYAGDSNIYNGSDDEFRSFATNADYRSKWGSNGAAVETTVAHDNGDRSFSGGGFLNIRTGIGSYWEKNKDRLGDPIGKELKLSGGAAQDFTNGYRVLWNGTTGAVHDVYLRGAIGAAWVRNGNENGFGYPINNETKQGDMYYQDYTSGVRLTWTEKNGTHKQWRPGGIYNMWQNTGGYARWGAPMTSEIAGEGGVVYQDYRTQAGKVTRFSWTEAGGTRIIESPDEVGKVQPNGDVHFAQGGFLNINTGIGAYWNQNKTKVGDPVGHEQYLGVINGSKVWAQDFTSGHRVYWSERHGGQSVWTRGAIGGTYMKTPARYGYPISGETYDRATGMYSQEFSSGITLTWTPRYGTQEFWRPGAIYSHYQGNGGASAFGIPVTSEVTEGDRVYQDFVKNGRKTRLLWENNTVTIQHL